VLEVPRAKVRAEAPEDKAATARGCVAVSGTAIAESETNPRDAGLADATAG